MHASTADTKHRTGSHESIGSAAHSSGVKVHERLAVIESLGGVESQLAAYANGGVAGIEPHLSRSRENVPKLAWLCVARGKRVDRRTRGCVCVCVTIISRRNSQPHMHTRHTIREVDIKPTRVRRRVIGVNNGRTIRQSATPNSEPAHAFGMRQQRTVSSVKGRSTPWWNCCSNKVTRSN